MWRLNGNSKNQLWFTSASFSTGILTVGGPGERALPKRQASLSSSRGFEPSPPTLPIFWASTMSPSVVGSTAGAESGFKLLLLLLLPESSPSNFWVSTTSPSVEGSTAGAALGAKEPASPLKGLRGGAVMPLTVSWPRGSSWAAAAPKWVCTKSLTTRSSLLRCEKAMVTGTWSWRGLGSSPSSMLYSHKSGKGRRIWGVK